VDRVALALPVSLHEVGAEGASRGSMSERTHSLRGLFASFYVFTAVLLVAGCGAETTGPIASASDGGPAASGTDANDAGSTAPSNDAGRSTGSVKIVNLSYALPLTLNFVLRNDAAIAIESIEGVEVQFDGDAAPAKYSVDWVKAGLDSKTCIDWTIQPNDASGVIELGFVSHRWDDSSGKLWYTMDAPCNGSNGSYAREVVPQPIVTLNAQGKANVTLRLRGLLSNGAPWSAVATGAYRG
jgi:hypothetical protein